MDVKDIKNIRKIVEIMKANDLSEFSLKEKDFELKLKRGNNEPQVIYTSTPSVPAMTAPSTPASAAPPAAEETEPEEDELAGLVEIPSPIVGTFYRRPAPDAEEFVTVGSEVTEDTVVCIVEAMKVMNEIKAEVSGIIRKVLVEDATPVQYGQPLFLVEPK